MTEKRGLKIIGEKINGTLPSVFQAIGARDEGFIQELAVKQAEAGAAWLDVNAGTRQSEEPEDLIWLIETIQSVVQIPLCLDSTNPQALQAAIRAVDRTPMINSINGEPQRLRGMLPLVVEHGCQVIVLAMDSKGIPEFSEQRVEVVRDVLQSARAAGVPDGDIYVDALAMTLATNTESALIALESMRAIRQEFPETHLTLGLSNISYGLPARSYINRTFLILALTAGLDTVILDPLDRELMATLVAARLVLGQDRHCLEYTRAFRDGMFDVVSATTANG